MYYILSGHDYVQDVQPMLQTFYPNEQYKQVDAPVVCGLTVMSGVAEGSGFAALYIDGEERLKRTVEILGFDEKDTKMAVKKSVYLVLSEFSGTKSPWGILTGIRPAKIVSALKKDFSDSEITEKLAREYYVNNSKAALALEVAKREETLLAGGLHKGKSSIYIGIPFCPTTCLYCSFTSYPIAKYAKKTGNYLSALFKELDFIGEYVKMRKIGIDSIYIGGGTPTSLAETDLEMLFQKIGNCFDTSNIREYSAEAGRPDTISEEKLKIMKAAGVSRISVNPQTLNQKTLDTIGRNHLVSDFFNAYEAASKAGFENINIDTILGLPGETLQDVANTFETLKSLSPVSVTVHTLAVKRASRLMESIRERGLPDGTCIEENGRIVEMLTYSQNFAHSLGLWPYYMYRQKNMLGNFENVGYAKAGFECFYNILIMGEIQTIFAAGAGAVTKVVDNDKIFRVFNVKNVDEYIERIDEMIERKRESFEPAPNM